MSGKEMVRYSLLAHVMIQISCAWSGKGSARPGRFVLSLVNRTLIIQLSVDTDAEKKALLKLVWSI
jgi:hypothetical protein